MTHKKVTTIEVINSLSQLMKLIPHLDDEEAIQSAIKILEDNSRLSNGFSIEHLLETISTDSPQHYEAIADLVDFTIDTIGIATEGELVCMPFAIPISIESKNPSISEIKINLEIINTYLINSPILEGGTCFIKPELLCFTDSLLSDDNLLKLSTSLKDGKSTPPSEFVTSNELPASSGDDTQISLRYIYGTMYLKPNDFAPFKEFNDDIKNYDEIESIKNIILEEICLNSDLLSVFVGDIETLSSCAIAGLIIQDKTALHVAANVINTKGAEVDIMPSATISISDSIISVNFLFNGEIALSHNCLASGVIPTEPHVAIIKNILDKLCFVNIQVFVLEPIEYYNKSLH